MGITEAAAHDDAIHRAILHTALDCIVTMDAEGRIVEFNPAAERTFGVPREEAVGREMAEVIVPPALRQAHRAGVRAQVGGGPPKLLDRRIEIVAMRADGSEFPVELEVTRIDQPGGPVFAGHIRDITDRKAAEEELRRSRSRLVEAADAARRQIERDLHDGAQQRLVSLALDLRVARSLLPGDPDGAAEVLDDMREQLAGAIEELRDLARGIHPAALTDEGLGAALRLLARRAPLPVELEGDLDRRYPAPVEATAYFVVSEALTNAVKHAAATHVRVAVDAEPDALVVTVVDDGRGGATMVGGSGLAGLDDRVAANDGALRLTSPPGGGTTLRVALPLRDRAA